MFQMAPSIKKGPHVHLFGSDQTENLHALLKLAGFHFLFSKLFSQTAPTMSFMVGDKQSKKTKKQKNISIELRASLASSSS
jgi:hypothetical protein